MKEGFQVKMRPYEILGGIVWFLIYNFFMGYAVEGAMKLLGVEQNPATLNGAWFLTNFIVTAILFRRFLAYSLPVAAERPLKFLRGILLGFCVHWLLSAGLTALVELLGLSPAVPNDDNLKAIAGVSFKVLWVGSVLLAPITEETLIRGLIFGNIRRKSRLWAYVLTALIFGLIHILPYITGMDGITLGYNLLVYGLPSVALCVCYELSGTVWAPILLHMVINFMGMSAL